MSKNGIVRTDNGLWIDEDGDDVTPVVTHYDTSQIYHRRDGGCDNSPASGNVHYDRFAAEQDGLEACPDCFMETEHKEDS